MVNNTLVNDNNTGIYVKNMSKAVTAKVINNIFDGFNGEVIKGLGENLNNLVFKEKGFLNFLEKRPEFVNKPAFDYRLKPGSPAVNAGIDLDKVNGFSLIPLWHYVHICKKEERKVIDKIDIGAYEF